MIERDTGQEFREGEVEVRLNDQPLEHVVECNLKGGWATIVEIDYRTGQPVVRETGEIATLTVRGKLALLPKAPAQASPPVPQPGLDQPELELTCSFTSQEEELPPTDGERLD